MRYEAGDRVVLTGAFFRQSDEDHEVLFHKEGTVIHVNEEVLYAPVTVELDNPPVWLEESEEGNRVYAEHDELTPLEEGF